jgi:3-dehydroquinate synthetase
MNKKIIVNTKEKKYTIEINNNFILNRLKKISNNKSKLFIIIDTSVNYLLDNLNLSKNVCIIKIKGSEKIKDFKSYIYITKKILNNKVNRNSTIIAIGGGTIGDLSGFIASTILRGINYILVPTTLLSQVDSSIGGKNGINSIYGKGLIGTFYQPDTVLIDISF